MKIEFLGVGSCLPEQDSSDTASLLIDRHVMVDCGWSTIRNLKRAGLEPHDIDTLIFTHMHQDHYMGLVQFLFYLENGDHTFGDLKIYGPEGLDEIMRLALTYTGFERYYQAECGMPDYRQLVSGETLNLPGGLKASCVASHHAVPGFSYRFTDEKGSSMTYSGDTAPYPELIPFAAGSDVLIHEASFDVRPTPENNPYCHSSCMDAAQTAKAAGAKALYMVHASGSSRQATLDVAGKIFSPVFRPTEGDVIDL